jgi:lipid A disaccharide synthetase
MNKLSKKELSTAIESAVNIVLQKELIPSGKKTKKAIKKASNEIYAYLKEEHKKQQEKIAKLDESLTGSDQKKKKKKKPEKVEIVESI